MVGKLLVVVRAPIYR